MLAEVRSCSQCHLRYPWHEGEPCREQCPHCGAPTERQATWETTPHLPPPSHERPARTVALALDNLRSAWNVGALFRTADGLGVIRLYLGGITPTPEHHRVRKTALGAEKVVPWQYVPDLTKVLQALRASGWVIWALEQTATSRPLMQVELPGRPVLLVVGNEVSGVGHDLFPLCDTIVHLPMRGIKRSLNVEVAAAIALWYLLR